jgi:hypothetical protein
MKTGAISAAVGHVGRSQRSQERDMNVRACFGLGLFLLAATASASSGSLTPEQKAGLCKIQSTVNQLRAVYDDRGGVVVTWRRVNPGGLLQYRLPPRSYPVETRIALDGDAMNGRTLENAWYDALSTADRPQWFFPLVPPGPHTVSVVQKDECGNWGAAKVAVTSAEDVDSSQVDDVAATQLPDKIEFQAEITKKEAQDLSAGANLKRYADCMVGSNITKGKAAVAVIRRQAKKFILKFVTSPLTIVKHPVCLIQATGGLHMPPDPDAGVMICHPQSGMYTQCPAGWETFYKSSDGTKALDRMGPGPLADGRDDQSRLSCLAVIYTKYNEYGRNLDRAFEDAYLINQGCNKAVPAGSR